MPEKREEVTTEGGLDLISIARPWPRRSSGCRDGGIGVSLFLDPDPRQLDAASKNSGVDAVELHTGQFAGEVGEKPQSAELAKLEKAAQQVRSLGLVLHAGHGLTYRNVKPIAAIAGDVGAQHRAWHRRPGLFGRPEQAVSEMKKLIA